ncbi:uncharacterized protein AMSG_03224 [Thecamonas trahens ATCC 50062]|uniref:Uncharacterized protein n=1 Tax=Thecamonas trahens ATCC 50062 TaxID=461836 RepID=A0A0L0D3A8_THETB|nr:hypothetical protein AMSG_03224 [Thecamonas trahens ATCC 50062]KNC46794.1 hypothetical protein AMSG_03224 [Thecamonas trahens ATCC 50062]|eukprot:XP_013760069.1 hypothetical protein AMSG_03224 [Thecamonas trahens ATCC 50062]
MRKVQASARMTSTHLWELTTAVTVMALLVTMTWAAPKAFVPTLLLSWLFAPPPSLPPLPAFWLPCWLVPWAPALDLVLVPAYLAASLLVLAAIARPPIMAQTLLRTLVLAVGLLGLAVVVPHERRLQPYTWELSWMLIGLGAVPRALPQVAGTASVRIILAGVYLASGLGKLTSLFAGAFDFVIGPARTFLLASVMPGASLLLAIIDRYGEAAAVVLEVGGGLVLLAASIGFWALAPGPPPPHSSHSLFVRVLDLAAAAVAAALVAMHLYIVVSLYAHGWNHAVWAWNLHHAALLALLWIAPVLALSPDSDPASGIDDPAAKYRRRVNAHTSPPCHLLPVLDAYSSFVSPLAASAYFALLLAVALVIPLVGLYGGIPDPLRYNLYTGNTASGVILTASMPAHGDTPAWPAPGSTEASLVHADIGMLAISEYGVYDALTERRFFHTTAWLCTSAPLSPSSPVVSVSYVDAIPPFTYEPHPPRHPRVTSMSCTAWTARYGCPTS